MNFMKDVRRKPLAEKYVIRFKTVLIQNKVSFYNV
jgi:hypothetical protein